MLVYSEICVSCCFWFEILKQFELDYSLNLPKPTPQIGVRAQFRCDAAVRRSVNCPELGSDPNFFASAGRSLLDRQPSKFPFFGRGGA
jgi:hypothetical protein